MPPRELPVTNESAPAANFSAEKSLLHDLCTWREQLARSIARNNIGMRSEEIATAVNQLIGRIVMLCIARDRGLVAGGTMQAILDAGDSTGNLATLFRDGGDPWADDTRHDKRQNTAIEKPVIEDSTIKKIITRLCDEKRPYDLAALSTEAIAQVFGQYLTQTIKRSAAHHARVVDTREVIGHWGNVAPTPAMIEYLAQSTVQDVILNRSRREILPIRILDPACGAGSVLLCAYQHLIERQCSNSATFRERKECLLTSIHGVDISRHAVAVTKMLLLFKLCEGERASTLPGDFLTIACQVFRELGHTIRCGNALIDPEIARDESWAFCPARERHALNLFSWHSSFPEIFTAGGFDAVIGALPAGPLASHEWIQQYFQRHYAGYHERTDRSTYFVEKGLMLLRTGGTLCCVMNDRWLRAKAGTSLRHLVVLNQIEEIVNFGKAGENTESAAPCIIRITNRHPLHAIFVTQADPSFTGTLSYYIQMHRYPIEQGTLDDGGWTFRDTRVQKLLDKIRQSGTSLQATIMDEVHCGLTGLDEMFIVDEPQKKQLIRDDPKCKSLIRVFVPGSGIGRYLIHGDPRYMIFIPQGWTNKHPAAAPHPWRWLRKKHPPVARHLTHRAIKAKARSGQGDYWWETACDQTFWCGKDPKIIFRTRFSHPAFAFDNGHAIADHTTSAISSASLYLLGVLNSRLAAFVFSDTVQHASAERQYFSWDDLKDLPIYTPDFDNPRDAARHKQMVALVTQMLDLNQYLPQAKTDQETRLVQQEIEAMDVRIDALVYELYGLTPEEIAVVEETVGR